MLLLSPSEVCYNPRLLKAGDYFTGRGAEVTVFNPVFGIADLALYESFKASRAWRFKEYNISKRDSQAWAQWAWASLRHLAAQRLWKRGWAFGWSFPHALNKGLIGLDTSGERYDVIVSNLVDTLPLAAELKRAHGAVLVYDSQEFFTGQARSAWAMAWVREAERRCIGEADVVIGTTDVMAGRLDEVHGLSSPALRVRNAPSEAPPANAVSETEGDSKGRRERRPLRLVWHGFQINYRGRGVDVILDALRRCESDAELYLQGRVSDEQRALIQEVAAEAGVGARVYFKPPAHPEEIVASIRAYDVGVSAEQGADENQLLTSSNKVFEYMHAGLAVLAPDLPGLAETLDEYDVGLLYPPSDPGGLARCIDMLAHDRARCEAFQSNARAAAAEVTWQRDYSAVFDRIVSGCTTGHEQVVDGYDT
ncbi:MAG: glycosyltransferase family 4 protein [Rhodothermales bacterium]